MEPLTPQEHAILDSIRGRQRAAESVYRAEMHACNEAVQGLIALIVAARDLEPRAWDIAILTDGRAALVTPPEEPEGDSESNPGE